MLNIEEFDIKLDTDFIGRNFVFIEQLESTNSFLMENEFYQENGTVVISEYQSQGRGRRGREWNSMPGQNLTFSMLLVRPYRPPEINVLNLGASLAIAQSIENLYQLKVNLKWPNDVLIDNKKVAGILLDSASQGDRVSKVVVGMGINVNQSGFEGEFLFQPTSIRREFGQEVSRERLLSEILNNYEYIVKGSRYNAHKILQDWKSRCKLLGEKIQIVSEKETKYGIFDDIDEEGYLVLKSGEDYERISYGDVSLR